MALLENRGFLDYLIGCDLDICLVTGTFLTERNDVTKATLHPPGYSFYDQPRLNGDAGGGIGVFANNSCKVDKMDYREKRSLELAVWNISWQNVKLKACLIYHIPYSPNHPVTDATLNLLKKFRNI